MINKELYKDIKEYIETNYTELSQCSAPVQPEPSSDLLGSFSKESSLKKQGNETLPPIKSKEQRKLQDVILKLEETFSQMLLRLINENALKDTEVYKKANIDRKLFSKIKNNKNYMPSKNTAIAFAIALRLNLDDTLDLIGKSGYTFSNCSKSDIIIKFFIEEGIYDIFQINESLYDFGQSPLI